MAEFFSTAYPDLAAIEALLPSNDMVIQRKGGAWVVRTMDQLRKDLKVPLLIPGDGAKHAVTGTLTETLLASRIVPGGALGPNGFLEIHYAFSRTSNANAHALRVRLGGTGITGSLAAETVTPNIANDGLLVRVFNVSSEAAQKMIRGSSSVGLGGSTNAILTAAVDTSADWQLAFTGQLATATADEIALESFSAIAHYGA